MYYQNTTINVDLRCKHDSKNVSNDDDGYLLRKLELEIPVGLCLSSPRSKLSRKSMAFGSFLHC